MSHIVFTEMQWQTMTTAQLFCLKRTKATETCPVDAVEYNTQLPTGKFMRLVHSMHSTSHQQQQR